MSSVSYHVNIDELLVTLLVEFRPHRQPHSQIMDTWNYVLKEFNKRSGLRYKQSRTLKRRFDKLCRAYIKYGDVKVGNVDDFKRLIREFEQERNTSENVSNTEECSGEAEEAGVNLGDTSPAEVVLDESDEDGQAPLDSIKVLPHTQMKRIRRQQQQENDYPRSKIRRSLSGSVDGHSLKEDDVKVGLEQQVAELKKSFEEFKGKEEEAWKQMTYKLDYIISLLSK